MEILHAGEAGNTCSLLLGKPICRGVPTVVNGETLPHDCLPALMTFAPEIPFRIILICVEAAGKDEEGFEADTVSAWRRLRSLT